MATNTNFTVTVMNHNPEAEARCIVDEARVR
jgi:hypothetical protein